MARIISRLPNKSQGEDIVITKDSKNILVSDDSQFFRGKLSDVLMEAGHRVRCVKDGGEVISELKKNARIDLIVLDLQMPEVDGFSVLKWMGENGFIGKVPVLAITGAYEPAKVISTLKGLGASGFMSKDYPPEQIIYKVNRILYSEQFAGANYRKRVSATIPVDFTLGSHTYTGVIISISEGGAFIRTNATLTEGTVLSIRFALPGSSMALKMDGTVRWFPSDIGPMAMFSGCGIMFTTITGADKGAINSFIDEEIAKLNAIQDTVKQKQ